MKELCELMQDAPTFTIMDAFAKGFSKIRNYERIMVSISGGADSDRLIEFCESIGYKKGSLIYVFFDTGMEFAATKKHLDFLEKKYGVEIHREKAVLPVPLGCRKYGVPFLSKQVSEWISRLQRHGFKWEDKPFEELYEEYPNCKAALRWWCNEWGENSRNNIKQHKFLKEFMVENPPDFDISNICCVGAKKNTAKAIAKKYEPDLDIQGLRKAEGGARSQRYSSCFDKSLGMDKYRPLFWFKKEDCEQFDSFYNITHSDCYIVYGLPRTGCACCPFGSNFEKELEAAKEYEPKLYKAATKVFGNSYEYTRKYKNFVKERQGS